MKLLFICNQNLHRSRTAEDIFSDRHEVRSAGLYRNEVSAKQLDWADLVVVMEEEQRAEIGKRFPAQYLKKRIISLDIPDIYAYGDEKLREVLQSKASVFSTFSQT